MVDLWSCRETSQDPFVLISLDIFLSLPSITLGISNLFCNTNSIYFLNKFEASNSRLIPGPEKKTVKEDSLSHFESWFPCFEIKEFKFRSSESVS